MTTPPLPTQTQCTKSWGYVDFKMPANENALTQTKFDLGICGIIQDVFPGDYTTKQKFEINFFETFPKSNYQDMYHSDILCPFCEQTDDSQRHASKDKVVQEYIFKAKVMGKRKK